MALPSAYTQASGRIPDLFSKIRDGQAPDQFTQQLLKDWQFRSTNDRALIRVLKAIGFLSEDGKPTASYHDYRDHSKSRKVLGRALRQNYGDIFLIKEHPTSADKEAIQGKFKSYHNVSDTVSDHMARTFINLLTLADLTTDSPSLNGNGTQKNEHQNDKPRSGATESSEEGNSQRSFRLHSPGLHYNIQIHLPATKDIEVYNAIFKSLRGHLLEA
jgi:hypothetical protein